MRTVVEKIMSVCDNFWYWHWWLLCSFFSYFHLFSGNVASKEDRISIAFVEAKKGTAEPYLTLHYDEWICIKKGKILFENDGGNVTANAGDTVFIKVSKY